ncbi:glycosyltransferase [Rufibacter immobilis]|uniref:glycosyltransferase n=1 Tax=Rufibacter immobilis TaxID=1348778 RepID=UPI0035EED25E
MMKIKQVLFWIPYPSGEAPSQRFRFEQYFSALDQHGIGYKLAPFLDENTWHILYLPGKVMRKAWGIFTGFLRRLWQVLLVVPQYDFVFVHREAAPLGPPIFEWLTAKVWGKKLIYDFDDAIWLANTSEQNKIAAGLKWHQKVNSICKWAWKVSCGNRYLCTYAAQFNAQVVHNPTTIDTVNLHNPDLYPQQQKERIVIGWTGTHSTMPYLLPLVPVLQRLEQEFDFEFCVISNQNPLLPIRSFSFRKWSKESEIADLRYFDIGVMPLTDDKWAKGKCGFKALQYMSLEVPTLVSPVGVNTEIVEHGVNGYICATPEEWETYLRQLLTRKANSRTLGIAARETVEARYSVKSNAENFVQLFN